MKINLEPKASEPILVANFLALRKEPQQKLEDSNFHNIFSNEVSFKNYFEKAREAFLFVFNPKTFLAHLNKEPNKESQAYLKRVRRFGLILRDTYRFASKDNKCPEKFGKFIYLLGQYNDRYWSINKEKDKEDLIAVSDNPLESPKKFTDGERFQKYITEILSMMDKLTNRKVLPIEEFHDLRKYFRLLANMIQPVAAANLGKELHALFFALFELSTKLGDQHDDLVQKGIKGDVDYDKSKVGVEPYVLSEFKRIRPFIEKISGI